MSALLDETYKYKVESLLKEIIHLNTFENQESHILQLFDALTKETLSYPLIEILPPFSWICEDGTPIQFSVSLTQHTRSMIRYVTEMCNPVMSLPARVNYTRKNIPMILELINADHLTSRIIKITDILLPSSHLSSNPSLFGIWIGVQHQVNGITNLKFYFNLMEKTTNPWSMFREILQLLELSHLEEDIINVERAFRRSCHPNSVGIECSSNGIEKVKLYLRVYDLSWENIQVFIKNRKWNRFESSSRAFHEIVLNKLERIVPFSMVLCIGFSAINRGSYDFKLEVGPQYYVKDDLGVYKDIHDLAHILKFDVKPYVQILNIFSNGVLKKGKILYHDILGIGFNSQMEPRVNIYLRPNLSRYYNVE